MCRGTGFHSLARRLWVERRGELQFDAPSADWPPVTGKPIPPPKPRESIERAVTRIVVTASSDNCDEVNRLTAISRVYDACEGLQALTALPVSAAAAYGDGGAVIVFGSGESLRNAILILDSDGLYHLPIVDPFNIQQSVGTKFASEFDRAARETVDALRGGDCDAFKEVALARFGPGSTPDEVCTYLDESPAHTISCGLSRGRASRDWVEMATTPSTASAAQSRTTQS